MRQHLTSAKELCLALAVQLLLYGCGISSNSSVYKNSTQISAIAEAVSVKIDGVREGSGVLIDQDRDKYTALTAWHVVKDVNEGEELFVHTHSGFKYSIEINSVMQIGDTDMAQFNFKSNKSYMLAETGDSDSIRSGSLSYVTDFLPSTAVPYRIRRFLEGR